MENLNLKGQSAIVTGGARGIGLGIAARLAAEGAKVSLWDLNFSSLGAKTNGFIPSLTQVVDVADLCSVEKAFAEAVETLGNIDIFVNNAGISGPVADCWEYPADAWEKILSVDLTGVFFCCRTAIPHMRARGYGRIINVASIAGKEGNPRISAYAAAKAGVIGFSKSIARELVETRITVNCIAPVITETELFKEMTPEHIAASKSKIPMGRFLTISEIAAMVNWIASPECSFTTGFVFDLSGGRATY